MIHQRTFKVFNEHQLSDYLVQNTNKIQSLINSKLEDYILHINETKYINHLINQFTVKPINIDFENIFSDPPYEKQIPAEYFRDALFHVRAGESYPTQAFIYHLPYTGNPDLFQCRPSAYILWATEVFLKDQYLCFEVFSLRDDVEEINRNAQQIVSKIKTQLGHLIAEIERYNGNLPTTVTQFFQERKQYLFHKIQMVAALEVPVKKREDLPKTYAIPTAEFRKSVSVEPQVTEVAYEPEPTLAEPVYQDILQIIHDLGKGFEQLPSTYLDKGEEDLRDYIRLFLGLHFEGSTTSETFNKNGKTDILIQHENSNAFIAECKFWNGKKGYLKTITQLLGYLTWRDSKAAVIMFVRNKNLSSVLQTAEEVTPNHSNYLDFVDKKEDTWFNYRFHINDDRNREVKLGVLFFHIPEQENP